MNYSKREGESKRYILYLLGSVFLGGGVAVPGRLVARF